MTSTGSKPELERLKDALESLGLTIKEGKYGNLALGKKNAIRIEVDIVSSPSLYGNRFSVRSFHRTRKGGYKPTEIKRYELDETIRASEAIKKQIDDAPVVKATEAGIDNRMYDIRNALAASIVKAIDGRVQHYATENRKTCCVTAHPVIIEIHEDYIHVGVHPPFDTRIRLKFKPQDPKFDPDFFIKRITALHKLVKSSISGVRSEAQYMKQAWDDRIG